MLQPCKLAQLKHGELAYCSTCSAVSPSPGAHCQCQRPAPFCSTQALAQRRAVEAAQQAAIRLAVLQEDADRAAKVMADEAAANAADTAAREAERQALAVRRADVATEAAVRDTKRAAAAGELRTARVEVFRQRRAARRIVAAWRAYLASPARAARRARIVKVQALYRGRRDRRRVAAMAARRAVLRGLEEAAAHGLLDGMREAAQLAQGVGA